MNIPAINMNTSEKPNFFRRFWLNIQYAFASLKDNNRYPYVLEGETFNNNVSKTMLLYRVRGKNAVFEMSAEALCNDQDLIVKFHPLDVRIICYIAGLEQISDVPPAEKLSKLEGMKKIIFNR